MGQGIVGAAIFVALVILAIFLAAKFGIAS